MVNRELHGAVERPASHDTTAKMWSSTTLPSETNIHYSNKEILYNQSPGQQAFEELMRSMVPRICPAHIGIHPCTDEPDDTSVAPISEAFSYFVVAP